MSSHWPRHHSALVKLLTAGDQVRGEVGTHGAGAIVGGEDAAGAVLTAAATSHTGAFGGHVGLSVLVPLVTEGPGSGRLPRASPELPT